MDLHWLGWPAAALWALALLAAISSFAHGRSCRRHWRSRRRMAAAHRALWLLVTLLLALSLGGLGLSLLGYARLGDETELAQIEIRQQAPEQFTVTLGRPGRSPADYAILGDQWRLEARVIRWKLGASLAGLPPLYRLERLSGRYDDPDQEAEAPRSVHALDRGAVPDLWSLRRQHPAWLPFVDADMGSGVYLPLLDGGRYTVSIDRRGSLIARPDEATQKRLEAEGW